MLFPLDLQYHHDLERPSSLSSSTGRSGVDYDAPPLLDSDTLARD